MNKASSERLCTQITQAVKYCFSKSIDCRKTGCNILKQLLELQPPPIEEIICSGVVPQLVQFLRPEVNLNNKDLLNDAVLALGNIGVYSCVLFNCLIHLVFFCALWCIV